MKNITSLEREVQAEKEARGRGLMVFLRTTRSKWQESTWHPVTQRGDTSVCKKKKPAEGSWGRIGLPASETTNPSRFEVLWTDSSRFGSFPRLCFFSVLNRALSALFFPKFQSEKLEIGTGSFDFGT